MSHIKKCIKVSLNGETKRLKLTTSFETLCLQTQDCFKLDMPIKFFYLDDERELISVTSQPDLDEALSSEESALKLTVAKSTADARA
jgi:hypothetical protein